MPNKEYYKSPNKLWGSAVDYVYTDESGKMFVGNDEYETQVNYCPFTGTPAPKQMNEIDKNFFDKKIKKEFQN